MDTTLKNLLTCNLTAPELQRRKLTGIAEVKETVIQRKELENGYSYKFEGSNENLDRLHDFIKAERMCCSFLTFTLIIEKDVLSLAVTGPAGAKEFLKEELDL